MDNEINYLYNASVSKLRKETRADFILESSMDYPGAFIYEDETLKYMLTEEGRVMVNTNSTYDYQYYLKDHLGNTRVTFTSSGEVIQEDAYYPFGMNMAGLSYQDGINSTNQYLYNGKELQEDFGLGWYDYGARFYDVELGKWPFIDPICEKMRRWSPYAYALSNPIRYNDPDGMIPWPVNKKYNGFSRWISSWFGKRNIKDPPEATKYHKGLDINFGGGEDDYGAPVIATHKGKVHEIKKSTSGNGGRRVVIQSPDGSFQTLYFHLKTIIVKPGDELNEGDQIGTIGGSYYGEEKGISPHLHYGIKKKDSEGNLKWYNPTEGKGNSFGNIVDPQNWIDSPNMNARKNNHCKSENSMNGPLDMAMQLIYESKTIEGLEHAVDLFMHLKRQKEDRKEEQNK